mmetsp:Transcript_14252/g.18663  ORF Transcript_14252/g.18663 Transcript_14252/m.18663 type:complete len:447 (+) Transcript_14252:1-1341(+)
MRFYTPCTIISHINSTFVASSSRAIKSVSDGTTTRTILKMDKHLQVLGIYCAISFSIALSLHLYVWIFRIQLFKNHGGKRPYMNLSESQIWRLKHESPTVLYIEIAAYVFTWYGVSLFLTMFNKWFLFFFNGGFPFPLTASTLHMVIKLLMSRVIIKINGSCIPTVPHRLFWRTVVPIGVATALDVGASNLAFEFVTVSFYTILKSGALVWLLFWAILWGLEKLNLKIITIVGIISCGLMLASFGETNFSFVGFFLVMASSSFSGLRWALTQFLMNEAPDCHSPLVVIYLIAPASAVGLVPFVLLLESWQWITNPFFADEGFLLEFETLMMVLGGGVVSFFLVFAEVKLVELTSALTMGVFGQVKEILTIALAMLVFGDHMTTLNMVGLLIAMLGTAWYKREKRMSEKDALQLGLRNNIEGDLEDIFNDLVVQLDESNSGDEDSLT